MHIKSAERIAAIQARLDAATPGPWQRSRFVDGPQHRGRSAKWKADADRRERESVVRGPGQVGHPDCNVVLVFARVKPEDMELIVHAPQDLRTLLAERKVLGEVLMRAVAQRDAAQRERDELRLKLTSGQVLVNALAITPRTALPKLQAWARGESARTDVEVRSREDADAPLTAEDHAAAEPFKQRLVPVPPAAAPPSPLMTRPCPHGLMWPECVACRPATDTEGEDDEFADAVVHLARMFTSATPEDLQALRDCAADAQGEEPS